MAGAILKEAERVSPAVAAGSRPAGAGNGGGAPNLGFLFQKMAEARSGERDAQEVRREIGQFALEAKTMDEASFIKSFGRQLSETAEDAWPSRGYACTAVDAETGEFVVWNADEQGRAGARRRLQLQRAGRLSADHHQRPPLHRRRHALGQQRRPRHGP